MSNYRANVCLNDKCEHVYPGTFRDKWIDYKFCPYCGSKLKRIDIGCLTIQFPKRKVKK